MTETLLERTPTGLRPVDERGWRLINKLRPGETLVADVKDPSRRSGRQHRFWFALANILFQNQSTYPNFDHFRDGLLMAMGYCETYPKKGGGEWVMPKSLKFGKMAASEFDELVTATLDFAESMGWDRDALLEETHGQTGFAEAAE